MCGRYLVMVDLSRYVLIYFDPSANEGTYFLYYPELGDLIQCADWCRSHGSSGPSDPPSSQVIAPLYHSKLLQSPHLRSQWPKGLRLTVVFVV